MHQQETNSLDPWARFNTLRAMINILLIDECPGVQDIIAGMLYESLADEHEVLLAPSLEEACRLLNQRHVDLIMLTLELPDGSGVSTVRSLKGVAPSQPILILAEEQDEQIALECIRAGAHDVFPKRFINPAALARVVRYTIECAQRTRLEQELAAADRLQASLYPSPQFSIPGVDVAGAVSSAGRACGDYFDILKPAEGMVGLVVGDVSGHGMAAALRMVEIRAYLRCLFRHESDVGAVLTQVNERLLEDSQYGTSDNEQFVTLFLAAVDCRTGVLRYASAGHPGYIVRDSGEAARLESTGLPLGIANVEIEAAEPVRLNPGDILLLATDGIEEAMNESREKFGVARMMSALRDVRTRSSRELIDDLYGAARAFAKGAPQLDDMTAVVLKFDRQPVETMPCDIPHKHYGPATTHPQPRPSALK